MSERDPLNQELDDLRGRCEELEAVVEELRNTAKRVLAADSAIKDWGRDTDFHELWSAIGALRYTINSPALSSLLARREAERGASMLLKVVAEKYCFHTCPDDIGRGGVHEVTCQEINAVLSKLAQLEKEKA